MGLLGDLVVRVVGDTADFVRKIDQSGRKMKQFDRDMKKIAQSMTRVGRRLTLGITLPILGIAAAAIKVAGDFETSMNRVRAVTGATDDEMRELEATARELGETTQFSAAQAADAMSFLAMAGFEANKIIGAMPATLNLAAAAQIDMATAADIASNILAGFNLDADELSDAIDVMAKTFTSSNTDLVQLGEAMALVAPISEGLGVSIEETSAAIGILSNAGIQASAAGTGLRRTLSVLVTKADQLGIATLDAEGNMRPLADILDDLEVTGLSTADALEIFGQRAGPAISVLLAQGGDALREFTEELENAGGTAENIAKVQMEGLNGALKRFISTAEESGISIGNILLPAVMDLLEGVRQLFERFNALDDATQRMILQYAGMAASIGPLILAIGLAIKAFLAIKIAVVALNAAMAANPVIAVTTAIAALATGIVLAIPVIVRMINRQREYKALLFDTENQLKDLTLAEVEASRLKLLRLRVEEVAERRAAENFLDSIRERRQAMIDSQAETGIAARGLATLNVQWEAHSNIVNRTTTEIDALTAAVAEADKIIEDKTAAVMHDTDVTDENTDSIDENIEAIKELAHVTRSAGKGIKDLADVAETAFKEEFVENVKEFAHVTRSAFKEIETDWSLSLENQIEDDRRRWAAMVEIARINQDEMEDVHVEWIEGWVERERKAAMDVIAARGEVFTFIAAGIAEQQTHLEQFLAWYVDNYIGKITDSTQELVSAIVDFANTRADAEIAALDKTLLSEEAYDAAVRAIQREQAQRTKRLGIFNAVIDTAQAVIGMLADPGGVAGIVLSILAGITGAAQIAAIASQPLPALATGGIVTGPTPAIVGEGGQPEIIFPLDQLGDFLSRRGDFDDMRGGETSVVVNLDGAQILKYVGKATEDGRLFIRQRAVV